MEFELALRLPDTATVPVLPLRLVYRQNVVMVLDGNGSLDDFPEDWEAANDMAGVTGRIIHWFDNGIGRKGGTYGFEAILLAPGRRDTEKSVWLTFTKFEEPVVDVTAALNRDEVELAMPLSGAEFVRGRCQTELKAIQALLVDAHPTVIEDDIRAHAPWLTAGGEMRVGSRLSLFGEDVPEEAVVFNYLDHSQMAVTARSIHVPPITYGPNGSERIHWGYFGRA